MDQVLIFKNSIGEIYVESGLIFNIKTDNFKVKNTIIYHLNKIFNLMVLYYELDNSIVFFTRDTASLNDSYLLTQALEKAKEILNKYKDT
ncbi:MAG: hypothetical protein R3321_06295 [Nitrososphaeraceae archaeon]|nr:hypothetical protein [Nitrososphaeraceae archaeon]